MGAAKGSYVTVSCTCRLPDGTPFDLGELHTLRLLPGTGKTLPTLEEGIAGMEPGERRSITVPAAEVNHYLRTRPPTPPPHERRPGFGYDFGPGESGDVLLTIPHPPVKPPREVPSEVASVLFEVTLLSAEGSGKR